MGHENDVHEAKCGQIYKNGNVIKPFFMAFGHLFNYVGGVFIKEEAFIRINSFR